MKIKITLLAVAATCLASLYRPEPATAFDYSPYTYRYTENGQTYNVPITQEAKTKRSMQALIRTVYTNPNIPGWKQYKHKQIDSATMTSSEVWRYVTYDGTCIGKWLPIFSSISSPVNHGITPLLVQMKADVFNAPDGDDANDPWDKIKSIKLITNTVRIDGGSNPGTLCNIEGDLNKFFIITKGKPGEFGQRPFYRTFESYSLMGINYDEHTSSLPDSAYTRMSRGEIFPIDHNCSSVYNLYHPVQMLGRNYDPTDPGRHVNLMIFIPDLRLYDNDWETQQSDDHRVDNYYDSDHQPYFFMYTIAQTAPTVTRDGNQVGLKAHITLSWRSSMKDITQDVTGQEEFKVMRREPGGQWEQVEVNRMDTDQDGTTFDADSNLVLSNHAGIVNVTLEEFITGDDQVYEYRIDGRLAGTDFVWVQSPVQRAVINGTETYSDPQIRITLPYPVSTFSIKDQTNSYENRIGVLRNTGAPIKRGQLTSNTTLKLVRYDLMANGNNSSINITDSLQGTVVDKAYITPAYEKMYEGGNTYELYNVTFANEPGTEQLCALYNNDATDADQPLIRALDIANADEEDALLFKFTDCFKYTIDMTADPHRYVYRVYSTGLVSSLNPGGQRSNTQDVTPIGNGINAGYTGNYSLAQIMADTDGTLVPTHSMYKLHLNDNDAIDYSYFVDVADTTAMLGRINRDATTGRSFLRLRQSEDDPTLQLVTQLDQTQPNYGVDAPESLQDHYLVMVTRSTTGNTYGTPRAYVPLNPYIELTLDEDAGGMKWDAPSSTMTLNTIWQYVNPGHMFSNPEYMGWRAWNDRETPAFHDNVTGQPVRSPRHSNSTVKGDMLKTVNSCLEIKTEAPTPTHRVDVALRVRNYFLEPGGTFYGVTEGSGAWGKLADGGTTGAPDVFADDSLPVEWYNLQGQKVDEPQAGQILLRRQGNTITKTIIK